MGFYSRRTKDRAVVLEAIGVDPTIHLYSVEIAFVWGVPEKRAVLWINSQGTPFLFGGGSKCRVYRYCDLPQKPEPPKSRPKAAPKASKPNDRTIKETLLAKRWRITEFELRRYMKQCGVHCWKSKKTGALFYAIETLPPKPLSTKGPQDWVPTPEEIRERALEIRKTWSNAERIARGRGNRAQEERVVRMFRKINVGNGVRYDRCG